MRRLAKAKPALIALLCGLCCFGLIEAASAQVYKWVDEKGVTHYGERPPQNQKAQKVETKPTVPPDSSPAKPQGSEDWNDKNIQFERRRIRREQQAEREQRQAQQKRRLCNIARDDVKRMEASSALYDLNDKGERVFLDDAQRAAAIDRARHRASQYCS